MQNFVKREGCLRGLILYGVVRRRRTRRRRQIKSGDFQVPISQKLLGQFLSNLICKVMNMVRLKYINLIEIDPIVLELR